MKKLNLILGILSLLAALGLVYANLTLPPESIMFDLGYGNMPWLPPVALGILGIILISTSKQGEEKMKEETKIQANIDPQKAALNKNMETAAWGCFLIMLGGFMFVPDSVVEGGWWSIGVGLIMLGLNAARYFNKIRMSGFTTFLGMISIIGGVLELAGMKGIDGAIFLIVLGAYLILKPYFDKQKLFGKAEEG